MTGESLGEGTGAASFRSLEQAQAEIRKRISGGLSGDVRIVIHPGTYELTKPLQVDNRDVPADGSLTIAAAESGTVIISGGRQVSGWTEAAKNVWASGELSDSVRSIQLFVDNQRATRAREPDEGYFRVASTGDDGRTSFAVDDQAWQAFAGLTREQVQQVEVGLLHDWSMSRVRVAHVDHPTVHLADRIGAIHDFFRIDGFEPHPRFFLENARQFLDSEGEFYFEPIEDRVFLYSAQFDPKATSVVQPRLPTLLSIRGTAEQRVQSIHLEGIIFAYTTCPLPEAGYAGIQATHFDRRNAAGLPASPADLIHESNRQCPPAAIEVSFANNCTFRDCQFRHLGGGGIYLNQQTTETRITECSLSDIGANAIMIGETTDRQDPSMIANSNEVSLCSISRCGQILLGSVGIWIGISFDNRIVGNEVFQLPYTGISAGWRWDDTPTNCRNNLIVDNHIHHVMQVLSDGGGIYTLGRQPGTRLARNRIHDIPLNAGRAESNGIFMDEGSSEMIVEENIIYEVARSPIRFHKCKSNEIRSNRLFVADGVAPFTFNNTDESSLHFHQNQVSSGSPESSQQGSQ